MTTTGQATATTTNGEQVPTPTISDAAHLIDRMLAAGTVARLDLTHHALVAAYRAGQRDQAGQQ